MDRETFLAKLRYYAFPWHLDSHGQIRATDAQGRCFCPITGVAFKVGFRGRYINFLSNACTWEVIRAADNEKHCDRDLRRQLLEACGLDRVED